LLETKMDVEYDMKVREQKVSEHGTYVVADQEGTSKIWCPGAGILLYMGS
jgi:frataxin-like iron-binding protein CyaY